MAKRFILQQFEWERLETTFKAYYRADKACDNDLTREGLEWATDHCQKKGRLTAAQIERWKRDVDAEGVEIDDNP